MSGILSQSLHPPLLFHFTVPFTLRPVCPSCLLLLNSTLLTPDVFFINKGGCVEYRTVVRGLHPLITHMHVRVIYFAFIHFFSIRFHPFKAWTQDLWGCAVISVTGTLGLVGL